MVGPDLSDYSILLESVFAVSVPVAAGSVVGFVVGLVELKGRTGMFDAIPVTGIVTDLHAVPAGKVVEHERMQECQEGNSSLQPNYSRGSVKCVSWLPGIRSEASATKFDG